MRRWQRVLLTLAAVLGPASFADAQPLDSARYEVSGGVRWIGPVVFPAVTIDQVAPGGSLRAVASTSSSLNASAGADATFGVRLTRRVGASVAVAFNSTHLSTAVSNDVESVPNTTASELVTQVLVEGGVSYRPARVERWRLSPVLTAGGGFLRQLNEGRTLVQNGQTGYVGVGLRYVERARKPGRWKASGIRADVRLNGFHGGVALDDGVHLAPSVAASVFAWF